MKYLVFSESHKEAGMKTITILGAAGRVGEVCARRFVEAGWKVRGVARGDKLQTLAEGVEPVSADAMDRDSLVAACQGSDVILHALNPTYDKWKTTVMPLGRNVLAAAQASGATVMIPGNVYNFGKSIGLNVNENAPFEPDTSKGKIRIELEQLFADASQKGVRTIVLRAGDFFGGERDGTWLDLMILKDIRKGRFVWPGPYDLPHAFAYLPDFAGAFVCVAERRASLENFSVFHFTGHTATGSQMHSTVEKVISNKLKRGSVPWLAVRVAGIFNPLFRAVAEMSYLWHVSHSLEGDILEELVDVPHTPLDQALRQTIADQNLND